MTALTNTMNLRVVQDDSGIDGGTCDSLDESTSPPHWTAITHARIIRYVVVPTLIVAVLSVCVRHLEVVVKISDSRNITVHLWHGVALDQEMADEQIGFGSRGRQRYANVAMQLRTAR